MLVKRKRYSSIAGVEPVRTVTINEICVELARFVIGNICGNGRICVTAGCTVEYYTDNEIAVVIALLGNNLVNADCATL